MSPTSTSVAGSSQESEHENKPESTPLASIEDINPTRREETQPPYDVSQTNSRNLPCGDLLRSKGHYHTICAPLYKALFKGDWELAQVIIDNHPELDLVGYAINEHYDTALHIVASSKSSKRVELFVQYLVNKMTREQLELKNDNDYTAFCLAAAAGNVKAAMTMLNKNHALGDIPGRYGMTPLYMASSNGDVEMVNFLYENSSHMSGDHWTPQNRRLVLQKCVEADIFDVAFKIVSELPELAKDSNVLGVLARRTDAFRRTNSSFIYRIIRTIFALIDVKVGHAEEPSDAMYLLNIMLAEIGTLPKEEIDSIMIGPPENISKTSRHTKEDVEQLLTKLPGRLLNLWKGVTDVEKKIEKPKYPSRVLFVATEMGNIVFVVELIRQYPDLVWKVNDDNQSIFHVAVIHRHVDIYNLVHEIGLMKDMITRMKDVEGNNMLHLVGKRAKRNLLHQNDTGVGLKMQRELLWFKEVEALLPPSYRERKNKDGLTPHELFMEEHKDLLSANEKWMKDTANQCLIVATLIASIAFAAAFGVPGGYNQNTGIPMFLHSQSFIVFAISDAISLAFASTSILVFLSIFTSRYAELDFLESLPKKLMTGLATLFLAITAMLVGFSISFFVIFQEESTWVPITIAFLVSIPIILYARLQYKLLVDVYHSTFGSKLIFRPKKHRLFYENPRF